MTDQMNPVERLRAAATRLRKVAGGTTWSPECGPWWAVGLDTGGVAEADVGVATARDDQIAAYVATMYPGVALELADWLDKAGADEWAHGPHCLTPCYDCDDDPRAPHIRSALAVADAVLGSERS